MEGSQGAIELDSLISRNLGSGSLATGRNEEEASIVVDSEMEDGRDDTTDETDPLNQTPGDTISGVTGRNEEKASIIVDSEKEDGRDDTTDETDRLNQTPGNTISGVTGMKETETLDNNDVQEDWSCGKLKGTLLKKRSTIGKVLGYTLVPILGFDLVTVSIDFHLYLRDAETTNLLVYLYLLFFFFPSLLLLVLLPFYYIAKKSTLSPSNIAGAFGLAALFPLGILCLPIAYLVSGMVGGSTIETKLLIPFAIGE